MTRDALTAGVVRRRVAFAVHTTQSVGVAAPCTEPVSDATICFGPNGIFINGHLFVLGVNSHVITDDLRYQFSAVPKTAVDNGKNIQPLRGVTTQKQFEWARRSFFSVKSDAEGRVMIRNLPGDSRASFKVSAAGFVMHRIGRQNNYR